MLRDDVIILTAIEAHSERSTRFTQAAFVCLGRNSLSGYCQVRSRSTAIALPYARSIWVFPWESPRKILRVIKCHSGRSRAHLAVSTERVSSQTNESCLCKSSWPFTMGLYGSQYDYVIRVSLITSFQPTCVWPCSDVVQIGKMLVYGIMCATTRANWRRSLYSYSTEHPPTVTRLCTVAKLVLCWTIAECPL